MRIASVGHVFFAATMIVLGIMGLIKDDFAPVWEPVPKGVPARETLVYVCALISLGCGIGLVSKRAAATASSVLLTGLLIWLLLFRVPVIFRAPTVELSYQSCGETAVIVAGSWVLYAWFAVGRKPQGFHFASGEMGVRIARALFGLALIAFGLSHFAYVNETAALVPSWLPSHKALAYFTGFTYIAAALAVLIGMYARLAAALSALQMGLFTLLVWIPIIAVHADSFQWNEAVLSGALTAAAWVVADSYRVAPWLVVGKRKCQGTDSSVNNES
jgi:uncharacterized membrane protein